MATADGDADAGEAHVEHPLLADGVIERRRYQLHLADSAARGHTLVCLPTGLGKTTVSLLVTARRLHGAGVAPASPPAAGDDAPVEAPAGGDDAGTPDGSTPGGAGTATDGPGTDAKSLLLAPTKPLVRQHAEFYREALAVPEESVVVFTGEVSPEDRADLFADARVVVATPQVVENDLVGNRLSLSSVVHCTFDECHRATGDYAYNYIADRYHADAADPLVTGMSASPGGDAEAIREVCENLGIVDVEVMTEEDEDVADYTHETDVTWQTVELPEEVLAIRDALDEVIRDRLTRLKEMGVVSTTQPDLSQKDLNEVRGRLQELIDADDSTGYEGMSLHAEVMKLRQAVTLVETQSVEALRRYFERQRQAARSSGASKADQRMVSDPKVRKAMERAESYDGLHPKYSRARRLVAETLGIEGGDRVIVFTESRDTAEALTDFLGEHFPTRRFVGQNDREGSEGMTQREQAATLDAFRDGEFSVLVSTSVAEEGLDVPEVDLVLFFEPVPTAIRSIQRRGRTGRQTEGRVVVLMAEDTRDEAYFWISRRREEEMEAELRSLKSAADELSADLRAPQADLDAFDGDAGEGDAEGGSEGATGAAGAAAADGTDGAADPDTGDGDGDDGESDDGGPSAAGAASDHDQPGLDAFAGSDATGDDADGAAAGGTGDAADGTAAGGTDGRPAGPGDGDEAVAGGRDGRAGDPGDGESGGSEGDGAAGGTVATARADADAAEDVEVVVDQREMDASIPRDLSTRDGVRTRLETLAVGDYVLSDRVVVERKTTADFLDTLVGGDRSVFEQAGDMARHYARPVLVLEGGDLYGQRNVHPDAVRGALASLAVEFDVSVLRTRDENDTADLLQVIAGREQREGDREVSVHGEKQSRTLAEQQEYVVAAIADVGPVTARSLLSELGSVEAVMSADRETLREAEGVGEVTADRIREVAATEYDPS